MSKSREGWCGFGESRPWTRRTRVRLPVRGQRQALPCRAAVRALPEAVATTRVDGLWTRGDDLDAPNATRVETQLRPRLASCGKGAAARGATAAPRGRLCGSPRRKKFGLAAPPNPRVALMHLSEPTGASSRTLPPRRAAHRRAWIRENCAG